MGVGRGEGGGRGVAAVAPWRSLRKVVNLAVCRGLEGEGMGRGGWLMGDRACLGGIGSGGRSGGRSCSSDCVRRCVRVSACARPLTPRRGGGLTGSCGMVTRSVPARTLCCMYDS